MKICQIKSVKDLSDLGQRLLGKVNIRMLVVICLNDRKDIIGINVAHIGSLKDLTVRGVFKYAMPNDSDSIAILQNHPSDGNMKPSLEEREFSEMILKAGSILGIRVWDHLIITEGNYFSLLA